MYSLSGSFHWPLNVAVMVADCIDLGLDGCADNDENLPAEIAVLEHISTTLRDIVRKSVEMPENTHFAPVILGFSGISDLIAKARAAKGHEFTVIWGNIGDGHERRLDHVTVDDPTHEAIMQAAWRIAYDEIEKGEGDPLTFEEFSSQHFDGFAILTGHQSETQSFS